MYTTSSITSSILSDSLSLQGLALKRIRRAYFCVYSVHKFFKSLNASWLNCLLHVSRFVSPWSLCFSGCVPACLSVHHFIGIVCAGFHSELLLLSFQCQPLQQHSTCRISTGNGIIPSWSELLLTAMKISLVLRFHIITSRLLALPLPIFTMRHWVHKYSSKCVLVYELERL